MTLIACHSSTKYISKTDFKDTWPFTVDQGEIQCVGEEYAIVFSSGGKKYAVNDAAVATGKYESVENILRIDDNYPGQQVMMDISNIEFEGLKLCDR